MNTKAQVEVSYNWIYVLVAGAVIFGFFITIIVQERDSTEQRINERLADNFENLIQLQLQQSEGLTERHSRPGTNYQFFCDETGHSFRVGDEGNLRYLNTEPVFSVNNVGQGNLITQNLAFKAPFHLSPLILVSDTNTRYSFESGDSTILDLRLLLGDEFNKQDGITNLGSFENEVVIKKISNTDAFENADVVVGVEKIESVGRDLALYKVSQDGNEFYLLNQELVLAAIVSGDLSTFNCALQKVEEKSKLTVTLEVNRSKSIGNRLEDDDKETCATIYKSPSQGVTALLNKLLIDVQTLNKTTSSEGNNFLENVSDIRLRNMELTTNSCPRIY